MSSFSFLVPFVGLVKMFIIKICLFFFFLQDFLLVLFNFINGCFDLFLKFGPCLDVFLFFFAIEFELKLRMFDCIVDILFFDLIIIKVH